MSLVILIFQLNQQTTTTEELNGFINNSPIYVTSLTATENLNNNPTVSKSTTVCATSNAVSTGRESITTPKLLLSNQTNGHDISGDIILTQQLVDNTNNTVTQKTNKDVLINKVPNDVRVTLASVTPPPTSSSSSSSVTTTVPVTSVTQSSIDQLQRGKSTESPNAQVLDVRKLGDRRASSPFQNGRTELLIGAEDNKLKTTAVVESNNNKLVVETESR